MVHAAKAFCEDVILLLWFLTHTSKHFWPRVRDWSSLPYKAFVPVSFTTKIPLIVAREGSSRLHLNTFALWT